MCSLAAARPRRRACITCQTSRAMMPTSTNMVAALIRMKERTTSRVGSIRVSPVSTTKVRQADNSATPTANGATNRQRDRPLDSANDGANDAAEVSALVILTKGELKAFPPAGSMLGSGVMHSYHNVAKLRQFRGASCRPNAPQPVPPPGAIDGFGAAKSLIAAPVNLNVQIANLLPQRVAVETQQVSGADLIAAGRRQRRREQRHLDLLEDAVIEPRRRHAVGKAGKMR